MITKILKHLREFKYVSIDIESTGLSRFTEKINVISFGFKGDKEFLLYGKELTKENLKKISRAIKKNKNKTVWANGKFDVNFIYHHNKVDIHIHHDTMLLGYMLSPEREDDKYDPHKALSLKALAKKYLGVDDWDVDLKEKTSSIIDPKTGKINKKLAKYSKLDARYTLRLFFKLYRMLDKEQKKIYLKLLMPVYNAYVHVERRGIMIDLKRLKEVKKDYEAIRDKLHKKLQKKYPINYNSPKQVQNLLFNELGLPVLKKTKTGAPSAGADVLKKLKDEHPIITKILEWKNANQRVNTFLKPWTLKNVNGRIYPGFNLHTTSTGRTSSNGPNLQQVPRDKAIRTLFTAPKGYTMVEVDYSQIELRIVAWHANERAMKRAFKKGLDLHTNTAKKVMGIKGKPTYEERNGAKAFNFGLIYGMMAKSFKEYAEVQYGIILTMAEAEQARDRFLNTYPQLRIWHQLERTEAHIKGYVTNAIGRKRRLFNIHNPKKYLAWQDERRALNHPIQSLANELLINSMATIHKKYKKDKGVYIVGTVHDSILFEIDTKRLDEVITEIVKIMEDPPLFKLFNFSIDVPIVADVEIGNWGGGVEWDRKGV